MTVLAHPSPAPPLQRVFVDFENVPNIDLGLVGGKNVHVTLLIGRNQTKISIDLVQDIRSYAAQVELIEVGASGHNALDFTLAFYLGQAVHRCPDAHFWIVSKDKDFEALIGHLRHRPAAVTVARCGEFDQLPFLSARPKPRAPAKVSTTPPPSGVDRRVKVIARLKNPTIKNRPTNRATLSAHIQTSLGNTATDPQVEAIIAKLIEDGTIAVDPTNKVTYPPRT